MPKAVGSLSESCSLERAHARITIWISMGPLITLGSSSEGARCMWFRRVNANAVLPPPVK